MSRSWTLVALTLGMATSAAANPCEPLAALARSRPAAAWAQGERALAPMLRIADPWPTDKAPPFERSLAGKSWVTKAMGGGSAQIYVGHLAGTDVYALSTFQGTLECQTLVLARGRPGASAHQLTAPKGVGEACWRTQASLATVEGRPVLLVHDAIAPELERSVFRLWPWTGSAWGAPCRLTLTFNLAYTLAASDCGDAAVCRSGKAVARQIAIAYNLGRDAGGDGSDFHFGPPAPATFAAAAKALRATQESPATWTPDYPSFRAGSDHPISYSGFALIPLMLDGKAYVAGVGHEGVGWREGANTLVSIYGLKGASLTPLAGFVIVRSLAGLKSATSFRSMPTNDDQP